MEEQTQPQEKPAQDVAAPSNTFPAQDISVPHHPLPGVSVSNGFNPSLEAAPMDQVLPEALQEVIPGAMPEILPGMLPTGEMFMPQLMQPNGQQMFISDGTLPGLPVSGMSAGKPHFL